VRRVAPGARLYGRGGPRGHAAPVAERLPVLRARRLRDGRGAAPRAPAAAGAAGGRAVPPGVARLGGAGAGLRGHRGGARGGRRVCGTRCAAQVLRGRRAPGRVARVRGVRGEAPGAHRHAAGHGGAVRAGPPRRGRSRRNRARDVARARHGLGGLAPGRARRREEGRGAEGDGRQRRADAGRRAGRWEVGLRLHGHVQGHTLTKSSHVLPMPAILIS
jgi:hypothetical protein